MKIIKSRWLVLWLIILIASDLLTKELTRHFFEGQIVYSSTYPYGGLGIFKDFLGGIDLSIGFVRNSGAAFGILNEYPTFLLVLRSALLIVLFYILVIKESKALRHFEDTVLLMIFSGALGNLIDNYRQGYVIDFINFHFYGYPFPLFNLADTFISIGAAFYILKEVWIVMRFKKFQV